MSPYRISGCRRRISDWIGREHPASYLIQARVLDRPTTTAACPSSITWAIACVHLVSGRRDADEGQEADSGSWEESNDVPPDVDAVAVVTEGVSVSETVLEEVIVTRVTDSEAFPVEVCRSVSLVLVEDVVLVIRN